MIVEDNDALSQFPDEFADIQQLDNGSQRKEALAFGFSSPILVFCSECKYHH